MLTLCILVSFVFILYFTFSFTVLLKLFEVFDKSGKIYFNKLLKSILFVFPFLLILPILIGIYVGEKLLNRF